MPRLGSCRTISTNGSEVTTRNGRIKAAGVSASRRCKHSLTPSPLRGKKRSLPDHHQQRTGHLQKGTVCKIKYKLLHSRRSGWPRPRRMHSPRSTPSSKPGPEFWREVQHPSALSLLDFPFLGAAFASSKYSGRRRRGRENRIFPWCARASQGVALRVRIHRGVKYDKAVECLIKDRDALLAFYDFPAEHWKHLRTTTPIESSFATVRHRTVRSKGCLSNKTALAMIFKLAEAAEKNWRRLDGHNQ